MEKIAPFPNPPPKNVVPYSLPSLPCTNPASGLAPSMLSKLCKTVTTPAWVSLNTVPELRTSAGACCTVHISIGGLKKGSVGICTVSPIEVEQVREFAGAGDPENRSASAVGPEESHPVKRAVGSQGESAAKRVGAVRTAEAVKRFEGTRGRYAEHSPEVAGSASVGSPVILSAGPQRKRCLWAGTVRTSKGVEHGDCPRLRVQTEHFSAPRSDPCRRRSIQQPVATQHQARIRNGAIGAVKAERSQSPLWSDCEGCPAKTSSGFRAADGCSSVNVAIAALRRSRKVGICPIVEG